jgi:hypothetical protein
MVTAMNASKAPFDREPAEGDRDVVNKELDRAESGEKRKPSDSDTTDTAVTRRAEQPASEGLLRERQGPLNAHTGRRPTD